VVVGKFALYIRQFCFWVEKNAPNVGSCQKLACFYQKYAWYDTILKENKIKMRQSVTANDRK